MSSWEFGFGKDDEEFFRDVFDSSQRHLQLARYSGTRRKHMVSFYGSFLFFWVFVLLHLVFEEKGVFLLMAFCALFSSMMNWSEAMRADGKYKMSKIVDVLLQQRGSESHD